MNKGGRMREWMENHVAEFTYGVAVLGVVFVAAVLVSDAGAATTVIERPDATVIQKVRTVEPPAGLNKSAGCKKPTEIINHKDGVGRIVATTYHRLYFCWDGKQVRIISADRMCMLPQSSLWWKLDKQALSWWIPWSGSDHGSRHDFLYCSYGSWLNAGVIHRSEIAVFANGGVTFP